jgi:cysteinyl-tRNA synthetase
MKVFNTLSGEKEDFISQSDEVKMYVCGVTPYDEAHLGHAMSYIIFDVIRRYLQFRGYKVKYVQNVTDIDDKIINRSNRLGISPRELADKFTQSYFEDMEALNIQRPDVTPYATEEIPKMIEIVQGLIDKGYAYPAQGSVYFRVRNVPDYGKLSHRSLESMMAGIRIEPGEEKEHPMDFVLWKASKPGEPTWESPWGPGRPGWHIECSAMSLRYLGNTIDIHGGGQDLVFPHHENEIAQSESFTGIKPFVKYWLHNGMVQLGGEKMSKSLGNLITIKQALEKYSPDAIRIFVLGSHYRGPLTYAEEILEAAGGGVERLLRVISRDDPTNGKGKTLDAEPYRKRFIEAMDDDFNTAQALATLFDLAREINQAADSGLGFRDAKKVLLTLAHEVLALKLEEFEFIREPSAEIEPLVIHLTEARNMLRKLKQWQLADKIRNRLSELGITLEDAREHTVSMWKREFKRQPTPADIEDLDKLLEEARAKLNELGIAFEDRL